MHSQSQQLLIIVYLSIGVILAIIIYFVYSLLQSHRKVVSWQKERIKAEVQTLEQERKRIAGDLHDELGPLLSAIKMQLGVVEPEVPEDRELLGKSRGQIDQIIQRFREISYNLMPGTLARKGFVKATEEFINRMQKLNGLHISFQYTEGVQLPAEQGLNLFRIVQEIVHNTLKHAQATQLNIEVKKLDRELLFSARENGVGFQYVENTRSASGLGLMNLHSRADILGGRLQLQSAPGKGVSYSLRIPLAEDI